MKSNYNTLGNYIRAVKVKNVDLKAKELLGININKFFMPSVANIVGTDLSRYKVVERNQFACNRMHVGRDYRIPVSLSQLDEPFMVSPAYDVFEIIDTKVLDPEYLMMWFSRQEFDRNAWFYTDADVRGGLAWKAFEDMQIPIPFLEKQREIVTEYNVIKNRIKLNNHLIQKLEETAQAIYKQWFVDFEFPNENGLPYKSNGGKMVFNAELDKEIPEGWEASDYENTLDFKTGKLNSNAAVENGEYPFFTCSSETFKTNTFSFDVEALLLAGNNASAIYPFKYFEGKFDAYQRTYVITPLSSRISIYQVFFDIYNELDGFKGTSSGTATKFLTMKLLNPIKILVADRAITKRYHALNKPIFSRLQLLSKTKESLQELSSLFLSKIATVGD